MNIKPDIEELKAKRLELKAKSEINKFALDDEITRQIQLLWEVGEGYAYAVDNRDTAKHILEIKQANTSYNYRTTTIDKVTDSKVAEHVEKDPDCIQQKQFYLACKVEAELWSQAIDVYSKRQSMIRDMVTMHTIGYYGSGLTAHDDKIEALKTARRIKDGGSDDK